MRWTATSVQRATRQIRATPRDNGSNAQPEPAVLEESPDIESTHASRSFAELHSSALLGFTAVMSATRCVAVFDCLVRHDCRTVLNSEVHTALEILVRFPL